VLFYANDDPSLFYLNYKIHISKFKGSFLSIFPKKKMQSRFLTTNYFWNEESIYWKNPYQNDIPHYKWL